MLLHGDCLFKLKNIADKSVDLVYLDPPFNTQKRQTLKTKDNSVEYSFDDTWNDINDYKTYIQERLVECHRVLKDSGSIFLHCDRSASHYLRIALDDVFNTKNFQSEIVWVYKRWSNTKKGLLNTHQTIYFYSKTKDFKFNVTYEDYSPTTNIDQIFQKRVRNENGKSTYKKNISGDYELIEEKKGVPLSDVWEIPYLNPKAKERLGYPTQKPIILLERIIKLTTDEGDTVLDPFCGSGTTLVSAKLLNRKFIGIDISIDAIKLTEKRLEDPVKSESQLLKDGKESYLNQDEKILDILEHIKAVPVQRNKGIDGFLKIQGVIKPIPVKIQREDETFDLAKNLLIKASQKNGFKLKVLVKTNDQIESKLFNIGELTPENDIIIIDVNKSFTESIDKLNFLA